MLVSFFTVNKYQKLFVLKFSSDKKLTYGDD